MADKVVVFLDEARLLPDVGGADVLVIALDTQAAGELAGATGIRTRMLSEYSRRRFETYDELYDYYEAGIRERLRPKDAQPAMSSAFEALWDDILQNFVQIQHIEALVREAIATERPDRVEIAIADRVLQAVVRAVARRPA